MPENFQGEPRKRDGKEEAEKLDALNVRVKRRGTARRIMEATIEEQSRDRRGAEEAAKRKLGRP